ncbi:MAG TPA: UDP-N-acetylmuramate--L-alanine ligase [Candidatus Dormibacteraeota bacterium]|jgi:UDP-N-acetylmuramate--alanine ligase|nr:UDP-N-acetylmuramate--L-alanine ligase [Candidatus Dormibacteraeota bacterium]
MRIHLLGIGGARQSAFAEVLLARGWEVSGCDVNDTSVTDALRARGAAVSIGHDPAHVIGQDLLVHITRIGPAAEPERQAALAAGVRVLNGPQLLSELIDASRAVGVAGTHGKTTITAMIGHILDGVGMSPTVLVGDGSSSRAHPGDLLVTELDESDTTLPLHHPDVAVVTNVEFDHEDYFPDLEAVRRTFTDFLAGLPASSLAVTCADDPWLRTTSFGARRQTYGFAEDAEWRCLSGGEVISAGEEVARLRLAVPGRHSLQNATAALAAVADLDVAPERAAAALRTFTGAKRRMERLGEWRGAAIYDDYGHHPTELRVTLDAARELKPRRLLLVFQPHRYSRLLHLRDQFAPALAGADLALVTEVYSAGEPNPGGVTAASLAEDAGCDFAPDLGAAREWLEREVREGDLVLLMGAGDIRRLGDELAQPV